MDSHSRSASPREQPRPQQRPPSPPSPRLPPAAFDNKAYQHDDADPNHNESFTSNGAQQNGHNKELNGESKSLEAVNLELINLTPKNGSLKQKKDVEVDMNGSNPYDEYFVPVNEHRKYMRGEKLYVTADKRGEKGGCKRPLCWTLLALVVAAIIALIALAATGVIFSNTPTPVDPYNVSISSARALGGIGQSHDDHNHEQEQHDHSQEQHDHSHDQDQGQHDHNQGQLDHNHDQNQEQPDSSNDQSQEQHNHTNDQNQEQTHQVQDHNENQHNLDENQEQPGQGQVQNQDQEENEHGYNEDQPQQGQSDLDHEHHGPVLDHDHEHDQSHVQDQGQHEQGMDENHDQHEQSQLDQDMNHNDAQPDLSQNSNQHNDINPHNPEILMPDTQNDEGRGPTIVPGVNDMSKYVPRTVEGELKIDNEQFLEAYNNPESDEYQQFTEGFKEALIRALFDRNTLEGSDNEIKLEVIQLRPGSVIVTYRISWKPKYEKGPTEDLLNATTLDEKINNYLINNNGMINIYHIAEDNLATRPVLDLCQINKNDCQEGCEFDESSLDFICTCPQGLILDANNLKMCVPSLSYSAPKPIQEISNTVTKPTLITTTSEPHNHSVFENNSEIETESTTEAESDRNFSIPFDEHMKNIFHQETSMEHNQQTNEGLESGTKQSVDMNIYTMTESIIRPAPEVNFTISPIVQNVTNYETYLKDRSTSESHEENVEPIPLTIKPELDQVSEEENETRQHMFPNHWDFNPNKITEVNRDLNTSNNETSSSTYDLEPDVHEGHYSNPAFNLDEVLESHQVIKPEEVYTEQPESTLSPNEENESKELSHSIQPETNGMSESNETVVSSEHFNPSTITASSEHQGYVKIMSDENFEKNLPTTTTVNPATITMAQHNFNVVTDLSQKQKPDLIINEKDISDLGETNINTNNNKSETNTDDKDDWLTDTLPSITATTTNSQPDTISLSQNPLEPENDTESRSFKSSNNGSETMPTSTSNDMLEINTLSSIPSAVRNVTIEKTNETEDYNTSAVAATDDVDFDRSVLDKNDSLNEDRNYTNTDYDKKQIDYDIPSIISQPKVPILNEMNPSEQEITTEVSENNPKIMNNITDSFDDAKYITFDDINMLLNRSSKSMDNLTENIDNQESHKTTANETIDLEDSPSKQNNSEWISESVTEGKYNDEVYTKDKTETSESVKNKIDHIMTHAKDDYEPDYLSKADDSIYMMERDYESEDPRIKRVNMENKDVTITDLPKDNKTETNSIFATITNTSEQISTYSPPGVVINVVTSTTSVPSTTVSEFIYNNAEKSMNDLNETSNETTTSLNISFMSQKPETDSESKEFNNDSNSETILSTINETSLGPVNTTSIELSPHEENDDTFNNTEASNKNNVNETQAGNLDVTIYEISHHTGNHSLPVSNSTNTQMLEYEDHETEMNPFLPETENNKNLVKKLQEGHDFELTNMNETQNENSDEHTFNSTEGHIINNIVNDEASTITPHTNEQIYMTPTDHKALSETPSDKTSVENLDKSESSVSNKIIQEDKDNNIETGKEVLPISTFLIDTDDLDANKISSSLNSFTNSPLSRYGVSNNENLSVVPITKDIEEENVPPENSKTQSRYELNDISDTSKNSDKRTFELANYDPFTNN